MARFELDQAIGIVTAKRLAKQAKVRILLPPETTDIWPIDYNRVYAWRAQRLAEFKADPELLESAKAYYKLNRVAFINHWCDTYDPRNRNKGLPVYMPLIMFKRQEELCEFVHGCMEAEGSGLVEKCRDMGATWVCIAISVHSWLFYDGSASGWGSATADKVDSIGDVSSIFEKARVMIRRLPDVFHPTGFNAKQHLMHKRLVNSENGSTITGEIGDNIGRGGRTGVYFVDEAAYIERPEAVDASLSENTRVRIDISSVSGPGTVFHRTRQAGVEWEPGKKFERTRTNVFIMDYSHHPAKTRTWFNERKQFWAMKGMPHVFAREVERNYSAAVEGVVIPSEYVDAAVDAHKILNFDDSGGWYAGLDVADGGQDTNALARRKGVILKTIAEWEARDPGVTCRRAVAECNIPGCMPCEIDYDCIAVGAGVKTEANRLIDEGIMPAGLVFVAWSAGAAVVRPYEHLIPDDEQSPKNGNYYANLKAQAWWDLRLRFYRTWHAITSRLEGSPVNYDPMDMISLDSQSIGQVMLPKLKLELSQATIHPNTRMKMMVDKAPGAAKSPNLADAVVMCYFPLPTTYIVDTTSFFAPIIIS